MVTAVFSRVAMFLTLVLFLALRRRSWKNGREAPFSSCILVDGRFLTSRARFIAIVVPFVLGPKGSLCTTNRGLVDLSVSLLPSWSS